MTGIQTDFYEVGFDSIDNLKRIDFGDEYFVYDVTFGDGNTGVLFYPYRVKNSSDNVVVASGPHSAKLKIPTVDETGTEGFRKRTIAITSDIPSWAIDKIEELVKEDAQRREKFEKEYNLRELEFY